MVLAVRVAGAGGVAVAAWLVARQRRRSRSSAGAGGVGGRRRRAVGAGCRIGAVGGALASLGIVPPLAATHAANTAGVTASTAIGMKPWRAPHSSEHWPK